MKITVNRDDLRPLIYFIVSMFQQDNIHRQGTSSKSDLIGGFIDRWINKIPEDVIFRKNLLVDKSYSVINDYFIYGSQSEKNAPDILGLNVGDQIIKFTEYVNNRWIQIEGMPHIEIKTFKRNQKLVSVRDTQLDENNYYIFIESNIDNDYLVNFFNSECLDDEMLDKIKMHDEFINENNNGILMQPPKVVVKENTDVGTLEIITIVKGTDFKEYALLCESGESIFYLKNIEEVSRVTRPNCDKKFHEIFDYNTSTKMYETIWEGLKTVPMYADNVEELLVLKTNKKSFYCQSPKECSIYNYKLEKDKIYKVSLEEFERSSKWNEYVCLKNQFSQNLNRESELIKLFDKIVGEYTA